MHSPENHRRSRGFLWALAISLALHGGILLLSRQPLPLEARPAPRLQASLGQRPAPEPVQAPPPPPVAAGKAPAKPAARKRLLAVEKPRSPAVERPAPRESAARREEMKRFLEELATAPQPRRDLARESFAMARDLAGRQNREEAAGNVSLELLPDSPPVDAFSLEMYVDGLVKKLNRSAAFVKNDPRTRGVRPAAVLFRLNPDGSLKVFRVLNAADQQAEIDFVRSIVEQSLPFSPFPADIRRSAQSLAMTICILPAGAGGGGFGFSRGGSGKGC